MTKTDFILDDEQDSKEGVIIDNLDLLSDDNEDNSNTKKSDSKESVILSKSKLSMINALLLNIKENHEKITKLLGGSYDITPEDISTAKSNMFSTTSAQNTDSERMVEGVFDGENMIGPDGKQYSIPANYASKSKLVEGDILKLTIRSNGSFVYKQIGPIERLRLIGVLEKNDDEGFYANVEGKKWKLITASVTYYRGQRGDEAVILIPKNSDSKWAAVENIVRNPQNI